MAYNKAIGLMKEYNKPIMDVEDLDEIQGIS